MNYKTDYKTITEKAEKRITTLMQQASTKADSQEARLYRGWAYGAYLMWHDLTHDYRTDKDEERLIKITEESQSNLIDPAIARNLKKMYGNGGL